MARLGPVCQLSGRCCRFKEYGHTLFVSTAGDSALAGQRPAASSGRWTGAKLARGKILAATAPRAIAGHWVAAFTTAIRRTNRPRTACPSATSPG